MTTPTLSVIATKQIAAGDENPRGKVDTKSEKFKELCASIEARGILQPILVGPANGNGKHPVVAGYRRHAAARKLKLAEIPAMVLDLEGSELLAALTENIQREDLSPVAEAQAIHQLQERHGFTQVQAGEALSKSERWVRERLRLLRLPEKTQVAYDAGALPLESLVPVEKVAEQAPKVVEAIAAAAAEDEGVRKAVGADNVPGVLSYLIEQSAEDLNKDGTSKLGCLVEVNGRGHMRGQVTYEALVVAGAAHEQLKAVKDKLAEAKDLIGRLEKLDRYGYHRMPDPMRFDGDDCDAAKTYGCLLEIDGFAYVTDASWLADRFLQFIEGQIKEVNGKIEAKKREKSGSKTKAEKGSLEEKAAKEERKRQREAEQLHREEVRAANLELGQRTERVLRSPKLSLEEAKLIALMVVGNSAEDLGARGLIYCYHDYQTEEQLKNGRTKVTYEAGRVAGEDLVKAIHAAKKPEEALGLALRPMVLATFADQTCVAPSSQSYYSIKRGADDEILGLIQTIATKRQVLPDVVRKRLEEQRQVEAEELEIFILDEAKRNRAKMGAPRGDLLSYYHVTPHAIDAAVDAKRLKQHGEGDEASYTITAAGKKRLEKLEAAAKERQAA